MRVIRPVSAVLLSLVLVASNAAVCAGWSVTADDRMACCAEDGTCPMERSGSPRHDTPDVAVQAAADRCCALSENAENASGPTTFVLTSSLAPTVSPVAILTAAPRLHAAVRGTHAATPPQSRPKHLLLSVLLV